jgi:ABC-type lipoprotein export system ATPase subunit
MIIERPVIVDIRNISKSYRRGSQIIPVLEDISLSIFEGEFLALMGPSGSGKSTLLNLIAGLDRADAGTITVGEVDISGLSETELAAWRAAHVGFIFQFYNLIPVLTAFENVELPLVLTDPPAGSAGTRADGAAAGQPRGSHGPPSAPALRRPAAAGGHRAPWSQTRPCW